MMDLGDDIEKLAQVSDRKFTVAGYSFTPSQIGIASGIAATVLGTLYSGFVMYQKVEEVANLDLGAYQQKMDVMDAKVNEALKYAKDIKENMRGDIIRVEGVAERARRKVDEVSVRTESKVDNLESKVRTLIDSADERFEARREQLRTSQKAEMKELEDRLNAKVQRALDNPLSK